MKKKGKNRQGLNVKETDQTKKQNLRDLNGVKYRDAVIVFLTLVVLTHYAFKSGRADTINFC